MKLFYEGTVQETYEMADALLNSYGILEESEWMDHFSDVIGSFCEIFDINYWDTDFECLGDLQTMKLNLEHCTDLTQKDKYFLILVNTAIEILKKEKNNEPY